MKPLLIKSMVSLSLILSLYALNIQTVLAHGEKALWPEDHQHDQRHAEEQVLQVAEIHPEQMHPE